MLEVPLTPTRTLLLDETDKSLLSAFKWRATATNKAKTKFYCVAWVAGSPMYLHRLILNAQKGQIVDHVNGNGLDNRRKNIRICTIEENQHNRGGWSKRAAIHSQEHPIYKGVWRTSRHATARNNTKTWEARICWERKQRYIGTFDLPEQAAVAYDDWARTFHGVFARLNFPKTGEMGVHEKGVS